MRLSCLSLSVPSRFLIKAELFLVEFLFFLDALC